ncbi:MAG: PAS domain S-box protein [Lysobacterales bacterium]
MVDAAIKKFVNDDRIWQAAGVASFCLVSALLLFLFSGKPSPAIVAALAVTQLLLVVGVIRLGRKHDQQLNRLNSVFNNSPILLYSTDENARIIEINNMGAQKLGYPKSELIGRQMRDFMPDEQREAFNAQSEGQPLTKELVDTGYVRNLKFALRRSNGKPFFASINAQLTHDSRGNIRGADCVVIDETDCVLAEESLKHARAELFRAFVDLPVPMFHCGADGIYLRANLSMLNLMGCETLEQLNDLGHDSMLAPESHRMRRSPDVITNTPHVFWNRQGKALDVQLSLREIPRYDDKNAAEGTLVDMTAHVEAQRVARAAEIEFRELYNKTPIMLYSVDHKGCVTNVNYFFLNTLGYQKEEVIGLPALDHFVFEGPRRDYFRNTLSERESPGAIDVQLKTRCGNIIDGSLEYKSKFDTQNVFQSSIVSVVDVTLERRAMLERDQMATELKTSQKLEAVGQLAAGIAHEINTPSQYVSDNLAFLTTAMSDVTDLMKHLATPIADNKDAEWVHRAQTLAETADLQFLMEEVPQALEQSCQGVSQISKIVRAMKDFSHPDAENFEPTDLNRLIESVLTVASNEWKYLATVDFQLEPNLPAVVLNPSAMNQVLLNLVVNASHAIAEVAGEEPTTMGTISVSTRQLDDEVEIVIADTGCGIPQEVIERVFDPFFTTKPVGKGTGQGLAIAHRIIDQSHGGKIQVSSEPGKGSKFVITLPLTQEAQDVNEAAA